MLTQYADIILLAIVAAGVIVALIKALGHKSHGLSEEEQEKLRKRARDIEAELQRKHADDADSDPQAGPPDRSAAAEPPPAAARAVSVYSDDEDAFAGAAEELRKYDRDFSVSHFLKGAESAFVMIIEAFAAGDRKTLRALTDEHIYSLFASALDEREKAGNTQETTLVKLERAALRDISREGTAAKLTVSFRSEQIVLVKNGDGDIVSGDPSHISKMHDIWTFRRNLKRNDPNWRLTATAVAPFDEQQSMPAAAPAEGAPA